MLKEAAAVEPLPHGAGQQQLLRLASHVVELIIDLVTLFWLVQTKSSLGANPAKESCLAFYLPEAFYSGLISWRKKKNS